MIKLILIVLQMFASTSMADVYRHIDEQGRVTYTDQFTKGAEKINVKKAQSFSAPEPVQFEPSLSVKKAEKAVSPYESLSITYPADQDTVRDINGDVTVAIDLEPELREGDVVVVMLDGKVLGDPEESINFQMHAIDRGEHQLQVRILDSQNKEVMVSDEQTFFLHRERVTMPSGPMPAPNLPPGLPSQPKGPPGT